jgi:hypothetical protein
VACKIERQDPRKIQHFDDVFSDYPVTDPVTLLKAAKDYGMLDGNIADSLTAKFMKKASKAAGHELNEQQISRLYHLFRHFDPFEHMDPEAGKAAPRPPEA